MRAFVLSLLIAQVFGLVLLAVPAFADPQAQNVSHGYVPKYWSMMTSVTRSNSLYITGDGNDIASWDFAIAPAIPLNRDYTLSALVEISQDINGEKADFGAGAITLTKASGYYGIAKRLKVIPRLSAGFPMSQDAKATSLQASLTPGARFEVNPDYLLWKQMGIAANLSVTRNFHQYDTAINGKVNKEWTAAENFEMSWAFNSIFSVVGSVGHYDMLSYQGASTDALSHGEELDIQMSSKWVLAFGHQWGVPYVSTRKANGQDLNFEATDEQNSVVYAQLTLIL